MRIRNKKRNLIIIEGCGKSGCSTYAESLEFATLHIPSLPTVSGGYYVEFVKDIYNRFLEAKEYPNNVVFDSSWIGQILRHDNLKAKDIERIITWLNDEFKKIELVIMLPPVLDLFRVWTKKYKVSTDELALMTEEYIKYNNLTKHFGMRSESTLEYQYAVPVLSCQYFRYKIVDKLVTNPFYENNWETTKYIVN